MSQRVTIQDLKGLLTAIEMAQTAQESGCEDDETLRDIEGASRCYDWVAKEIRRREGLQSVRAALRGIRKRAARP